MIARAVRYLSLAEVLELHRRIAGQARGAGGVRDLGALESSMAQPRMTLDGQNLYVTLADKARALGFSLGAPGPLQDEYVKRSSHYPSDVAYY